MAGVEGWVVGLNEIPFNCALGVLNDSLSGGRSEALGPDCENKSVCSMAAKYFLMQTNTREEGGNICNTHANYRYIYGYFAKAIAKPEAFNGPY